jgi:hypothetical protein
MTGCQLLSTLLAKNWAMALIDPDHLFEQAELLVTRHPLKPIQADLRRAMSSAYYGLFHFILTQAADLFVGTSNRSTNEYLGCFRSVDHKTLRELCVDAKKEKPPEKVASSISGGKFGNEIISFATGLVALQEKRTIADYDVSVTIYKDDMMGAIETARAARDAFLKASPLERREFLALLVFKRR